MIDVFEKLAPRYKKIVRSYAKKIWLGNDSKALEKKFLDQAELFSRLYKRELIRFYKNEGIKIFSGTIDAKANQWLVDQKTLIKHVKEISGDKKDQAKFELVSKMLGPGKRGAQDLIDELDLPDRKFSFSKHMQKKADQLGEQASFDLGADINNIVIEEAGDTYEWTSQEDSKVRPTHKKLNGKIFSFENDPTTIDKYGNEHTGSPGTDYGCRCYAVLKKGKPKLNYIARA